MKKLPLVLLSIALILFAFSSCSNSTGTPAPSQEDIDAVKNGINVETILKDAFSGKDGIDVKYEYPQAKAAEEASIKAIATFNGYTSGSLQITAGRIEFVFKGAIDGTSFFATTYSAKTTARLEVSSGNGNPVPVSIDIPESANATAEVKATITGGVLSTTSVQVTINNLPESSTATITIADEEATAITGTGTNEGTGSGGGQVTPPAEEPKEYPIPVFIAGNNISTMVSKALLLAENSDEQEMPEDYKYFSYRISCPAIIGFEYKEEDISVPYEDSLFEHKLTISIKEDNGIYTYTGSSETAAIELVFDSNAQKYDFIQVTKESYTINDPEFGEQIMEYYIISQSSDITKAGDTWSGNLNVYVWMKTSSEQYEFLNTLSAIFCSNQNATGLASYRILYNGENIQNVPTDVDVDIDKAKELINDIESIKTSGLLSSCILRCKK